MKTFSYFIIVVFFFGYLNFGFAQEMTIGGGSMTITENAGIWVKGNVVIAGETDILNQGNIYVEGDWLNNSAFDLDMQNNQGVVSFDGESDQQIGGDSRTFFSNLEILQNVSLDAEIKVSGNLLLDQHTLALNKLNLFILPGGTISGASGQGYVVADSEGFLIQQVSGQDVLFPVGTEANYLPAVLNNSGTPDNFGLQVFPDVLDGGTTGTTIPEVEDCVINTWNIIEEVPGGSDLDLTLQWVQDAEGMNFNRSLSAVGHYSGGAWIPGDPTNASGSGPWQQAIHGVDLPGAFAVGDPESPMSVTIEYNEQEIILSEGWSGISSYLNPLNPDFDAIFTNVIDQIEIVQNMVGVYWPSQGVNTLGSWDAYSGYQVKMNGSVALNFTGTTLLDATVDLDAGWNLIPILVSCRAFPEDLFAGMPVVVVHEVAGTGVYWPEFNINTLGLLSPGSAYLVNMETAAELIFPECKKSSWVSGPSTSKTSEIENPVTGSEISPTNMQHIIAVKADALLDAGFTAGDFLIALSQDGECFGSLKWNGGNASVTVFGDDILTREKDGFSNGEELQLEHWSPLSGESTLLNPVFDFRFASHDGRFMNNGISAISAFKSTGFPESRQNDMSIFPNPAKDFIRIQGEFDHATIRILTMQGASRMNEFIDGNDVEIDVSSLPAGVYILEINRGQSVFRKQLVVK